MGILENKLRAFEKKCAATPFEYPDPTVDVSAVPVEMGNLLAYDARAIRNDLSLLKPDEFTKMNIGVGNVTYTIGLFQLLSGEKRIPCGRRLRENTPRLCSRHRMMALSLRVAASVHPQGLNLWRMAKLREFNQGCIIFRDFPKRRGNVIQEAAGVALRSHPSGYPPEYFVFG